MSGTVRDWALRLNRALELAGQGEEAAVSVVAALLTVDLSNPLVSTLQNAILDHNVDIPNLVESCRLGESSSPPWRTLGPLARAYLEFCRDVDPDDHKASFDSYGNFLSAFQSAYSHPRGASLNGALRAIAREIAKKYAGCVEESRWIAANFLRIYNSICSDKITTGKVKKRDVVLFMAVMQCRLHFRAGQPTQCASVFAGLHTVAGQLSLHAISEQVEFRYWLGRFLLLRGEVVMAFRHLLWAYNRCYHRTSNRARILKWLAIPAVLVGRPLKLTALAERIGLDPTLCIAQIEAALKQPSLPALKLLLTEEWVSNFRMGACLLETGRLLIARRAIWKLLKLDQSQGRLALDKARAAFKLAGLLDGDDDPNSVRTESLCNELCQKGYLRAKVFPEAQTLVLPKQNPMPYLIDVTHALDDELGFNDDWMKQ